MRLISAEECPCYICGATCPYTNPIGDCRKFNNWIRKPAYDVDKVVEKLEMETCVNLEDVYKEAIDIVKRGGVDE